MQMSSDATQATTRREPIMLILIPTETDAQSCLLLPSTSGVGGRFQRTFKTAMQISLAH